MPLFRAAVLKFISHRHHRLLTETQGCAVQVFRATRKTLLRPLQIIARTAANGNQEDPEKNIIQWMVSRNPFDDKARAPAVGG